MKAIQSNLSRFAIGLIVASAVAATCAAAHGQDDPVLTSLSTRVDHFFTNLTGSGADAEMKALDELLAEGPLAGSDEIKALAEQVQRLDGRFGAYVSSEQIEAKRVGTDLVLMRFLYKAEKYPVVWYFTFYRPPVGEANKWVAVSVRFDTRHEALVH
jgi:hypothetical protein